MFAVFSKWFGTSKVLSLARMFGSDMPVQSHMLTRNANFRDILA